MLLSRQWTHEKSPSSKSGSFQLTNDGYVFMWSIARVGGGPLALKTGRRGLRGMLGLRTRSWLGLVFRGLVG